MKIAWNEIKYQPKKFILIEVLIVIMMFMVIFLSGLTNGLGRTITAQIENFGEVHYILSKDSQGVIPFSNLTNQNVTEIEALKLDPSLFNYGYEKNVIMVSHTTLMPILRTVANLWRIERGNAEAKEIAEKAGEIYNQICLVAERLSKLGNTLSTVSNQYNSTVTALVGQQGLVGKVERFKDLSAKANKSMPNVELLNNDVDLTRLSLITTENGVK